MSKTNLNKASAQSFQLIFPKLPFRSSLEDSEILTLNIHSTVLPSMTLSNTEIHWQGGKYDMAIPPITFEPWYTNFIVSSDYKNWYIIYEWMATINNNKDHYDKTPSDYWIDATMLMTDNFNKPVLSFDIENIYPTMLGEMSFSSREGLTKLESSVNFNYTRFTANPI